MSVDVVTIVAKNYLSRAGALLETLTQHDNARLHLLVVDKEPDEKIEIGSNAAVYGLEDLDLGNSSDLYIKFTLVELCTAVKARFLSHIFKKHNCEKLFYLDPDIAFFNSLRFLCDQLEDANMLLTPHFIHPEESGPINLEKMYFKLGTFNLGFIGLKKSETTERFLNWWSERTLQFCCEKIDYGIFTDQQWLNLAVGMFDKVKILRHPGLNVDYLNLQHRKMVKKDGGYKVDGQPLIFLHFHRFSSAEKPENYFRGTISNDLAAELFHFYAQKLEKHENSSIVKKYNYETFSDGKPFPYLFRQIYREFPEKLKEISVSGNLMDHAAEKIFKDREMSAALIPMAYMHGHFHKTIESRPSFLKKIWMSIWFRLFAAKTYGFPKSL